MKTIYVNLIRDKTGDHGTEGRLIHPLFSCFTIEPPWRDNQSSISCIPTGEYNVELRKSPKYGLTYYVKNVPNRSFILQHSGNVAGDRYKNFKTHSYGCILLGKYRGELWGQRAILSSRPTLKEFMILMKGDPYILIIEETY